MSSYLGRGVLVAFHPVESVLGSVNGKFGRVIATAQIKNSQSQLLNPIMSGI